MEEIVSLAKRRGFVFPGSEIYGGLSGTWDWGPLGVALKNNVKNLWWRRFVENRDDMYGVDTAILMNRKVWEASGHVDGFSDPLTECKKCGSRWRADVVFETQLLPKSDKYPCPKCQNPLGTKEVILKNSRQFNMMFKTRIGVTENNSPSDSSDDSSVSYLRPETAQGMFMNFKNVTDSLHPKLPFGLAQIGKAFRNEIAPRDFIFRSREFEQMEIEYFIHKSEWKEHFEYWRKEMVQWIKELGLDSAKIHELDVPDRDRAHYSDKTVDFEYDFPFGRKELYGLAYRTDFDLKNHSQASGTDLSYFDEESKERFTPHVIEPTFGLDRTVLAILCESYSVDELGGEKREKSGKNDGQSGESVGEIGKEDKIEKRIFLKLPVDIAPVKVAVFPLLKNKPLLVEKAHEIFTEIKNTIPSAVFDDNGNIGKRYRRQDEIGTPHCVTVDFETLEDGTVTLRDRDSGGQKRVKINEVSRII